MIRGLGIDVVEVARISEAMENPRFIERILTLGERSQELTLMRIAGRWAAKEAIAKAVTMKLSWQDVEITNDDTGQPYAHVDHPDWTGDLMISISHERGIAAAVAIWMNPSR